MTLTEPPHDHAPAAHRAADTTPSATRADRPPAIEAVGLTKRYGDVEALAGLDLVAPAGQVTAVLGPNGAGKTTFVKAVATLLRPDSGTLRVAGIDAIAHPHQIRRVIGLAGQNAAVEPALTGRENLVMVARLFGHRRAAAHAAADTVLAEIGLTDDADRPVRGYSGGMRRRLDLGASLVGAPRLLLLDEATAGLDMRSRRDVVAAVRRLVAEEGVGVLWATHLFDEIEPDDAVVLLHEGSVIARGTAHEIAGARTLDDAFLEMTGLEREALA